MENGHLIFKNFILGKLKMMPEQLRVGFIDDLMRGTKEAIEEMGLGTIDMEIRKDEEDIPDIIKNIHPSAKITKMTPEQAREIEENLEEEQFFKLDGEELEEFKRKLIAEGVELPEGFEIEVLKKTNEEHLDTDVKSIGDSVVVTSKYVANYMHDFDTKTQLSRDYNKPTRDFYNIPAIVVETGTDFTFNCGHCSDEHESDLVVYFPSLEEKYHISSRFVKLI